MSSPEEASTYMASSSVTVRQSHPSAANSRVFLAAMVCSSRRSHHMRERMRLENSDRMGMYTTETESSKERTRLLRDEGGGGSSPPDAGSCFGMDG